MMSTQAASRCSTSSCASGRASKSAVTVVSTMTAFMARIVALESALRDETHPAHHLRGHHSPGWLRMDYVPERERAGDESADDHRVHGATQGGIARGRQERRDRISMGAVRAHFAVSAARRARGRGRYVL